MSSSSSSQGISSRGHVGLSGSPKVDLLGMVVERGVRLGHLGAMQQQRQQQQPSSSLAHSSSSCCLVA
jgi:hypothetical protein